MVAGICYAGLLDSIGYRALFAQYGIVVGVVDVRQRAACHLADKAAGIIACARDIAGIVARIDDIVMDGGFNRVFGGRSICICLCLRADIDILDLLAVARRIFQKAQQAAGIGAACDVAVTALERCSRDGSPLLRSRTIAALDDFIAVVDNQLALLRQWSILIRIEHAVHVDALGMADDAAGVRRARHRAGVVGVGVIVNGASRAGDGAALDIAGNAADVFRAGDIAEVAHICERAAIPERAGDAARLIAACHSCAAGRIPDRAAVHEADKSAEALARAADRAGAARPAQRRSLLQRAGHCADIFISRDGGTVEVDVVEGGCIAGRAGHADEAHVVFIGAVDGKVIETKDCLPAEAVQRPRKGRIAAAERVEALAAVPLVRMDIADGRIVKARALEFIVSLLEDRFQLRVIADFLLQGIVLGQGCGRIR